MTFAMKYILMSKCITTLPWLQDTDNSDMQMKNSLCTLYSSLDDDLNAFVLHTDEKYVWTTFGRQIGQTQIKSNSNIRVTFYMEPSDSKVHALGNGSERPQNKDLFCDSEGCQYGYTRLVPVSPMLWLDQVTEINGKTCLKHLIFPRESHKSDTVIAFRCQFPQEAHEWLMRPRTYKWPSDEAIGNIVIDGCKVVPCSHPTSSALDSVWTFSFDRAEVILTKDSVTSDQKACFYIVKVMVDNVLPSRSIGYAHLKQVFFYMCEETDLNLWTEKPLACVRLMIERLLICCRSGVLPNYFISKNNMIEHITETALSDCTEKLELLRNHLFVLLYFTLDSHNRIQPPIASVFDDVICDTQTYASSQNAERSIETCFIPLAAEGLATYSKHKQYKELLKQSVQALKDLKNLTEEENDLTHEMLLLKIVKNIPSKQSQWICAFFLDQRLGTNLTKDICGQFPTVSLIHIFGRGICSISDEGVIPSFLTHTELLPGLAVDFTTMLKEDLNINGKELENCLEYFCANQVPVILEYIQAPDVDVTTRHICETQIKILKSQLAIEQMVNYSGRVMKERTAIMEKAYTHISLCKQYSNLGRKEDACIELNQVLPLLEALDSNTEDQENMARPRKGIYADDL